jgi:hypothetical protein
VTWKRGAQNLQERGIMAIIMASKESADEGQVSVSSASRFKANEYITLFFATIFVMTQIRE